MMKLYIKAVSSFKSDLKDFDVRKELKSKYKIDTRRQDAFIHLAVYGAQMLKETVSIKVDDELYITSGVGNIDILQKTNLYVFEEKEFIKPFDFINMLGNTTSYYVASSLGIKSKNTFQISDNFTFIKSLISIYASLKISKKEAILGSVDLATKPQEVIQRVLGVDEDISILSSVNYQKLSLDDSDAVASIEFDVKNYSLEEVKQLQKTLDTKIIISRRCENLNSTKEDYFFETMASLVVNSAIEKMEDIIYIECFENTYKVLKIMNLR